jgi:predicted CXXCH cytochrome family protein
MNSFLTTSNVIRSTLQKSWLLAASVALGLFLASTGAHSESTNLSKATQACLTCHDKEGEQKKLDNAELLPLHVSTKAYAESMHKETDCEDCHNNLEAKTHGKVKVSIKSRRAYSLSMGESCRDCHKKNFKSYEDGLHAALVKEGSKVGRKDAPLCSDCHNPHTVKSVKLVEPITATPCANCHEAIFNAYAKDVHGLERIAKGKSAPICSDCHQAHNIKAASMGDTLKDACLNCHKDAVQLHKDWLPNTDRHFEAISCPVCHAPDANRRVNLRLYDNVAKRQVSEKLGVPQFEKRTNAADSQNLGLDERALWSLLKEFNQPGAEGNTILRGRLEVRSGVDAHQISEKSKAIKDCNTCHQVGAEAFQSVSLTIAGPDGRPIRHGVQKDVLTSLLATESVRGFYAIGSTRIKLLDVLLVMVVLGALGVPLGHMTIKRLFKSVRDQREAEKLPVSTESDQQTLNGDRHRHDETQK